MFFFFFKYLFIHVSSSPEYLYNIKIKEKKIQEIKRANNPCEADNMMKDLASEAESFQTKDIDMLLFLCVSKLLW